MKTAVIPFSGMIRLRTDIRRFGLAVLLCSIAVSAWGAESGSVTLNCRNVPLREVLKTISRQAGISFVFNDRLIKDRSVTCRFKSASVDEILNRILPHHALTHRRTAPGIVVLYQENTSPADIRGIVRDAKNRQPLPYANVQIKGSEKGGASDQEGKFRLTLPAVPCTLEVSYIGYRREALLAFAGDSREWLEVVMTPCAIETRNVQVSAAREPMIGLDAREPGLVRFQPGRLRSLPSVSGADFQRVLQLLPGFGARTDKPSDLAMLGGGGNQNLIVLDGIPVCSKPELYFGMLNPFHQRAIEEVRCYQAGYPAQVGDCLSGIVEMTGNTVQDKRFNLGVGGDLFQAHAFMEWPVTPEIRGFVSFSRSFDHITGGPLFSDLYQVSQERYSTPGGQTGVSGETVDYGFARTMGKWTYDRSEHNRFGLTFYSGGENRTGFDGSYHRNERWQDTGLSFQWNHHSGSSYSSHLTCVYDLHHFRDWWTETLTVLDSRLNELQLPFHTRIYEQIGKTIVKWDNRWVFPRLDFHAGTEAVEQQFEYRSSGQQSDTSGFILAPRLKEPWSTRYRSFRQSVFSQAEFRVAPRLRFGAGLRAVWRNENDEWILLPRLSLSVPLPGSLVLEAKWGRYAQFHSPFVIDMSMDTPEDSLFKNPPSLSDWTHLLIQAGSSGYDFQAGIHYKETSGLWCRFISDPFNMNGFFVDRFMSDALLSQFVPVFPKDVKSLGADCMIQKKTGRLSGWLVWQTWISEFRMGTMNPVYPGSWENFSFPPEKQTQHTVKAVAVYHAGPWQWSVTGIGSRLNRNFDFHYSEIDVVPAQTAGMSAGMNYKSRKSAVLNYGRIDLGASRLFQKMLGMRWEFGISLLNVLNIRNIEDRYRIVYEYEDGIQSGSFEKRLLPVTLLFSVHMSLR